MIGYIDSGVSRHAFAVGDYVVKIPRTDMWMARRAPCRRRLRMKEIGMLRVIILVLLTIAALIGCTDEYPPCHPEEGGEWGPRGPRPTEPGPGPTPPPPPGAEPPPGEPPTRYSTLPDGEVCECGQYELGCVDSPDKARASTKPGAYCPFPREDGDPVVAPDLGLAPGAGGNTGTCYCSYLVIRPCQDPVPASLVVRGDSIAECAENLRTMLIYDWPSVKFSPDLNSIMCAKR